MHVDRFAAFRIRSHFSLLVFLRRSYEVVAIACKIAERSEPSVGKMTFADDFSLLNNQIDYASNTHSLFIVMHVLQMRAKREIFDV